MSGLSLGEILTDKEKWMLAWLARGCSFKSAAKQMGMSERSFTREITAVYKKLNVNGAPEAIAQAFIHGLLNEYYVPRKQVNTFGDSFAELTNREREVLTLLEKRSKKEAIARKLGIRTDTVTNYSHTARHKLGADTVEEAIKIAKLNGLLVEN